MSRFVLYDSFIAKEINSLFLKLTIIILTTFFVLEIWLAPQHCMRDRKFELRLEEKLSTARRGMRMKGFQYHNCVQGNQ